MKLEAMLFRTLNPFVYMIRRYPKAARKRRVRAKWRNRFGPSMDDAYALWLMGETPTKTPSPYDDEYVITFTDTDAPE
jgi:hypothetical protein